MEWRDERNGMDDVERIVKISNLKTEIRLSMEAITNKRHI